MALTLRIGAIVAFVVGCFGVYAMRSDIQLQIALTGFCAALLMFGVASAIDRATDVRRDIDWMIKRMHLEDDQR